MISQTSEFPGVRFARAASVFVLTTAFVLPGARAQEQGARAEQRETSEQTETIYLKNVTQVQDLNDIQTALRNALVRARIYGSAEQFALVVQGTPDELRVAHRLISELDRAKKVYRITYTVTELNNGQPTGTQHYSVVAVGSNKTIFKQGDRIPIVIGTVDLGSAAPKTQVQYLDVGLNIDAAVTGTSLRTKFERTNLAEEKSGMGAQDPVVHQSVLEGTYLFTPGRAVQMGSIDVPGSSRHEEIEVNLELIQ